MLPAPYRFGHRIGACARRNLHQHGIDRGVATLGGNHRVQQARHAGAVQRGALRRARALGKDGVVVFQKLGLLRVLDRDKNHGISARGHHAPGQPHHGVNIAANADALTQPKPGSHIDHGFVMATRQTPPLHQVTGLARMACAVGRDTHHHGAHIVGLAIACGTDLHGQVGHIGHAGHAWHGQDAAVTVVAQA